jgi:hypothetical protein
MKQYTTPEQIAKLIELVFAPTAIIKGVRVVNCRIEVDHDCYFTIGKLIEMLPTSVKIKGYDCFLYIEPMHYDGGWDVGYMRYNVELNQRATELIDAIYDMIIKLKEEGVI